jgi:hypothetical protein
MSSTDRMAVLLLYLAYSFFVKGGGGEGGHLDLPPIPGKWEEVRWE